MNIIAITVERRTKEVPDVQKTLTEYGENIIARLGLHNIGENKNGLIIIAYEGENVVEFIKELEKIKNIHVKSMETAE